MVLSQEIDLAHMSHSAAHMSESDLFLQAPGIKMPQTISDSIPVLAGDDSLSPNMFPPSSERPRTPSSASADLLPATQPAQPRREVLSNATTNACTEALSIPILAGDLGTPLPEPPSEGPSPSGPLALQAQVDRGETGRQASAQTMIQPTSVLSNEIPASSVKGAPATSNGNPLAVAAPSQPNHEALSPAEAPSPADASTGVSAQSQAQDLEGSLEALEASLLAAKQAGRAEAAADVPLQPADVDERVDRPTQAATREEHIPEDQAKRLLSKDLPTGPPAEATPAVSGTPADIPMLDVPAEESPADVLVKTPSPEQMEGIEEQGIKSAPQSPSTRPVVRPASPVSPAEHPQPSAEQQQAVHPGPAAAAMDEDQGQRDADPLLFGSAAPEESLDDGPQLSAMQQQDLQASRDKLLMEVQTLDDRVAGISKQLEELRQAQAADDGEIKVPRSTQCSHRRSSFPYLEQVPGV